MTEEEIKKIQKTLNAVLGSNIEPDGLIGPKTIKALTEFQEQAKIHSDGIYGPKTKAALEKEWQERNQE